MTPYVTDDEPVTDFDFSSYDKPKKQEPSEIKKGEESNLTVREPTLRMIRAGAGWDLKSLEGDLADIDLSVFLLDKNDKTKEDEDFIFYNNLRARDNAINHMGDSRTGAGDGDDETVVIDLALLPFDIVKIAFVLSVYDLDTTDADFSMVKNVYFRLLNETNKQELVRFALDQDLGSGIGLYVGFLERIGADWIFKGLAEPVKGGLSEIATNFGIIVAQNILR